MHHVPAARSSRLSPNGRAPNCLSTNSRDTVGLQNSLGLSALVVYEVRYKSISVTHLLNLCAFLSFSFRDHLSLVGRTNITHFSHPHGSFSVEFGFERRKCPSASAETSVCRERPEKEEEKEEFEKKEDGEKAPAAKRRKVPKSQCNVLHLQEDNLLRRMYGLDRPINETITTSKTHQTGSCAFLCICQFGD